MRLNELHDDEPLLVHLAKKLMDKGESITLHWDAPMEYASGKISSIEWDHKFRGVTIHFNDTTSTHGESDVFIKAADVDDFELDNGKAGWVIAKRDS